MKHSWGIVLFQRDLRIVDNTAFLRACKECEQVIGIFVFNPKQVSSNNTFKSNNAVAFMIESLRSLNEDLQKAGGALHCFYGEPSSVVRSIQQELKVGKAEPVLYYNRDITPFSRRRQDSLDKIGIPVVACDDYYLTSVNSVLSSSGKPYTKFTPYASRFFTMLSEGDIVIDQPNLLKSSKLKCRVVSMNLKGQKELDWANDKFVDMKGASPYRLVLGGRKNALLRMKEVPPIVAKYQVTRNDLSDETTQLSAYIKFGCVSIREVYYFFKNKIDPTASKSLIRQLLWRDFYAQVLFHNPSNLGDSMKEAYRDMNWVKGVDARNRLKAWKSGKTGFPIVDAGMRELASTGYMHNRARLITGSFLPKTLLVDWMEGEKHFARYLSDYDPASNNGNWQWVAGTGVDSQPYFRILNPRLQSERYDENATYIKKWIPELRTMSAKDIHKWCEGKICSEARLSSIKYPHPIVDYKEQKEKALGMYRAAYESS
tara:strand:- start:275 stop:1732 length:1458 start_codon:yes stop_codon:yes gene_type:complete